MDSQIEEIKNKLNIIDIIGGYMKITKAGVNYRGVCPFHPEKTPSFFVNPVKQIWHCFGCGAGFSIFDFVMKIEGVEFGDALRILANKAGVELKRENVQLKTERARLHEICDLACRFFEKQLEESSIGKEAKEYLLKRGISEESINKWRLGYSPDSWNSLSDFLVSKGYNRQEVIKSGLAIQKEGNKLDSYDRFRGRIIFPVFDSNSQVVGFGGRVFSDKGRSASGGKEIEGTAKYINTPQTLLYNKSNTLYGLNNAKLAIRKNNYCVITEGYTDVIMAHQAGFENTVASSGTALTQGHLNILKRHSENLILAFDMDFAGDTATKRGINLAEVQGFNIKVIEHYGEGDKKYDPADIILKDPKLWQESLAKSKSIIDYYFNSAFLSFDKNTPEGKREISKVILPAIKRLQNKIEQSHWIQKLASMLLVREDSVLDEMAKVQIQEDRQSYGTPAKIDSNFTNESLGHGSRKSLIEEKVISLILKNPDYIKLINDDQYSLFSEKMQKLLGDIKNISENRIVADEKKLEEDFKEAVRTSISSMELDGEIKNLLAALSIKAEVEYEEDGQEELKLCLLHLKSIQLKDRLNIISENIKKAENSKDNQKINILVEEFNKLTKEIKHG